MFKVFYSYLALLHYIRYLNILFLLISFKRYYTEILFFTLWNITKHEWKNTYAQISFYSSRLKEV